jgi:predicted RNA-binding Zn-ribbon protein involved in translation (DUF1610 family)
LKLLFLDIETSPITALVWGTFKQDVSVDQIVEPTKMLCWAAKFHGAKRVFWGRSPEGIHDLISRADAICTYYGKGFDLPHLNREWLVAGLKPPPPVPHVDLKAVVAKTFLMASNKLAFVGPYLGIGDKVKNSGWALWRACMAGDQKAWEKMRRYNEGDVTLLEKLYDKLLPWIDNHPNRNLIDGSTHRCPNCGSPNVERRGTQIAATRRYVRFQCRECGRWSRAVKCERAGAAVR